MSRAHVHASGASQRATEPSPLGASPTTTLVEMLAAAGDSAAEPVPVAIETPRGLLVAALRASGRRVYSINPMTVARYRQRHSVSGKKSDHADAVVLANILRTHANVHRSLPHASELVPTPFS